MIVVDAHCDTITKIMETNSNLYKNNCNVDLQRLKKNKKFVQFFAAFVDQSIYHSQTLKRAVEIIDAFYQGVEAYKDVITLCCNYNDIEKSFKDEKVAAILSIEGGEALQGDVSALRIFYRLGVRSICLTWNYRNEIADGVGESETRGGLTLFGKELVKEMNSLGMLIDLSHISENGFWDVMKLTKQPIIASHSNAKKICSHIRNLTDEQIIAIKENRGVIGINLCPDFLKDGGNAGLKDIVKHIEYIAGLTGFDHIGLGADFDGIDALPKGINGVEDIYKIADELLKLNYSNENVEKFLGKNFLRVIKEVL
ncbi:dipeptidase [Herbivorax sp. ANBcel31]|uniref:dipeptidase n=1 Tax=Herbivorax sp. ANBcel31 TaxID=3069754 RepID=UPI0027B645E1|nr:dipeptidase [Herbivorax sp. ANBcel31]MDQ2087199.1 dipeptidase [Herbivorax sp. ANBcel31]